jgi:radical SAM superfamily enzyme YgiQ (UPF0313 family)
MPVYNGEKYPPQAIESILHQTFTDLEFIVIDDGSTDSTANILRSYGKQLIVHTQANEGVVRALNTERGRVASLFTSRGCPFDCEFCSIHPVYGMKYRF